jgi:DNA polymerase elongation subunit (family B)
MEIKTLECRVELAKGIVREAIRCLLAREVELKDLTVSKSLKSAEHYKNKKNDKDDFAIARIINQCNKCKTKKEIINYLNCMDITYKDLEKIQSDKGFSQKFPFIDDKTIRINLPSISHLKLAQRMAEREPGSEPKPGDRMGMVYVEVKNQKAKQSERVEDPTYAIEHNLRLDVKYYFDHEFQVPISELFALLMDNPGELYSEEVRKFNNRNVGQKEIGDFFKVPEKVHNYMKYVKLDIIEN